ncbi:MAG: hypothetical protein WD669_10635 [Pirellulales bacterium]
MAKAKAAAPIFLDLLLRGWEQRQADEAAKAKAESDKRIADVIAACRLRDSKTTPPAGVLWHLWAERRVGCTAADVRAANEGATLADVLDDWHAKNHAHFSVDDIRRMFCKWYFGAVA